MLPFDDYMESAVDIARVLGATESSERFRSMCELLELEPERTDEFIYWENPRRGVTLVSQAGIVWNAMFFGNGKDAFEEFEGALPLGLSFRQVRADVLALLGSPQESGEPSTLGIRNRGWDTFTSASYTVHVTYSAVSGAIELVTLGLTDSQVIEPSRNTQTKPDHETA